MNETATYRKDLYYIQTRTVIRGGTIHGHDCPGWRERVVPKWKWFLLYRWQFWRFAKMVSFNVLVQADPLPASQILTVLFVVLRRLLDQAWANALMMVCPRHWDVEDGRCAGCPWRERCDCTEWNC